MNSSLTTTKVIENLMQTSDTLGMDARTQYLFRESLYSLVRLAKAEQMLEIKSTVAKLTGMNMSRATELDNEISVQPTYISVEQHVEFQAPKY